MLHERQTRIHNAGCVIQFVQSSTKYKPIQSDKNQHLPGGGERRWKGEELQRGTKVTYLLILTAVMVWGVCIYIKTYQIVHFKHVQFTVCQLYPSKAVSKNFLLIDFRLRGRERENITLLFHFHFHAFIPGWFL